jgi:aminoglycoside 6'-N-acetyltransferase I
MDVRLLGPGDEAVLARVADDVFDNAVDPALARRFLADPRHHIVVAVADGLVVGFVSAVDYLHPDKPPELWINEAGVAPDYQRRGIATALMRAMFAHGQTLGCTVAWLGTERSNAAAMGLYRSMGGELAEADTIFEWDLSQSS